MAVYFIKAATSGYIKIGYSASPQARLSQLQTGHFEKLELIGVVPGGDMTLERKLHSEAASHRVLGTEWFKCVPEVMAIVQRETKPTRPPRIYFAGKVRQGAADYRNILASQIDAAPGQGFLMSNPGLRQWSASESRIGSMSFFYEGPVAIRSIRAFDPHEPHVDFTLAERREAAIHEMAVEILDVSDFAHGPSRHGMAANMHSYPIENITNAAPADRKYCAPEILAEFCDDTEEKFADDQSGGHGGWYFPDESTLSDRCFRQISRSDLVVCFIDSTDCYGTLVELGYAKAKNKKIILIELCHAGGRDLWFARSMCSEVINIEQLKDLASTLKDAGAFDPVPA